MFGKSFLALQQTGLTLTTMEETAPTPPATLRRQVRVLAAGLSILIWGLYVALRMNDIRAARGVIYAPTHLSAIPFAVVLAYGMAAVCGLFLANRHRLAVVFRPNLGRVLEQIAFFADSGFP